MSFRLKLLPAALMLALSAIAAQAAPPANPTPAPDASPQPPRRYFGDPVDDKSRTADDRSRTTARSATATAVSYAASRLGTAIDTGVHAFGSRVSHVTGQATALIRNAISAVGVPYRHGGTSIDDGVDCSGFVQTVVQQTIGKLLPRRAADQAAATQKIDKTDLQPGDLVFFTTIRHRAYSHVGIYLGDDKFIHAPATGESVRIENMNVTYWQKRFNGARRILTGGLENMHSFAGNTLASADAPNFIVPLAGLTSDGHTVMDTAAQSLHNENVDDVTSMSSATDIYIADATTTGSGIPSTNVTPAGSATTAPPAAVPAPITVEPDVPAHHQARAQKHTRHAQAKRGHAQKHLAKTKSAHSHHPQRKKKNA